MLSRSVEDVMVELPPLDDQFAWSFVQQQQNGVVDDGLGVTSVKMKKNNMAVRACTHCKRLHAKCSNERPCTRCTHNGLAATCADSPRKPRQGKPKVPGTFTKSKKNKENPSRLSVFSDPANLVLTSLEGQRKVLSPAEMNVQQACGNFPPLESTNDIFIPSSAVKRSTSPLSPGMLMKSEKNLLTKQPINGSIERIYLSMDSTYSSVEECTTTSSSTMWTLNRGKDGFQDLLQSPFSVGSAL